MFIRLVLVAVTLRSVTSYQFFQSKIPNGDNVPFPCKPGKIWLAVGHILDEGTGTRNLFGLDFFAAGNKWTLDLCRKDSDGDGRTNGQELGDPDCEWRENTTEKTSTGISHPGICDPWNATVCMEKRLNGTKYSTQQQWLSDMCKSDDLECEALKEAGVQQLEIRLPANTSVPAQETTYECQLYDLNTVGLPKSQDFHMVAVTPIIDNRNVLHHMILFGCTEDVSPSDGPFECEMVPSKHCMEFLHVWTVGLPGECYHPHSGVRIGKTGYRIVGIQLHWNNPEHRSDFTDSSGVKIHYTPNLRTYDAAIFITGSAYFHLVPKTQELTIVSRCPSECTSQIMTGSVNITSAWNHMHYAGRKMSIHIERKNSSNTYLTNDPIYSYDSPQVHTLSEMNLLSSEPFQLHPGDSIISTCGFSTSDRNKTTFWGESTKDEMCFGFLTYYPKKNIKESTCVDDMGISTCDKGSRDGCINLYAFIEEVEETEVFQEVSENCRAFTPCLDECVDTIVKHVQRNPCLRGKIWSLIQREFAESSKEAGLRFLSLLASCKTEVYLKLNPPVSPNMAAVNAGTGCLVFLAVTVFFMQM